MNFISVLGKSFKYFFKTFAYTYVYSWAVALISGVAIMIIGFVSSKVPFLGVLAIPMGFLYPILACGIFVLIENIISGTTSDVGVAFSQAWSRKWAFIGFCLVVAIPAAVIGFIMIIFPPLFLGFLFVVPFFIFIIPQIVLREAGPISSFGASASLISGNYWQVFLHLMVIMFINMLFSMVFVAIFVVALFSSPEAMSLFKSMGANPDPKVLMALLDSTPMIVASVIATLLHPIPKIFYSTYITVMMIELEGPKSVQTKREIDITNIDTPIYSRRVVEDKFSGLPEGYEPVSPVQRQPEPIMQNTPQEPQKGPDDPPTLRTPGGMRRL